MRRKIILIFITLELFSVSMIFADDNKPLTKGEFKHFVRMIEKRFDAIDKRFEAVDKRFEDMNKRFEDMNKRFDMIFWFMGIGFPALALFSLFLFRITNRRMDERFEEVNKRMDERFEQVNERFEQVNEHFKEVNERFEQVNVLLLLLVKVHEKEIGSQAFDVAMGRLKMKDITREMVSDIEKRSVLQNQDLIDQVIEKLQPIIEEKVNGKVRSLISELKKEK